MYSWWYQNYKIILEKFKLILKNLHDKIIKTNENNINGKVEENEEWEEIPHTKDILDTTRVNNADDVKAMFIGYGFKEDNILLVSQVTLSIQ